jgi:transcriptional regulator with XRE-family HTH domain
MKTPAILDAAEVKRRRMAKGWTLEQAAKRAGWSGPAAWCNIEKSGDEVTLRTLSRVARALQCAPRDLIRHDDTVAIIPATINTRDEERKSARAALSQVMEMVSRAEEELSTLSVVGVEERYRLARARVELLRCLRAIDRAANTRAEKIARALEQDVGEILRGRGKF